MECVYCAVRGWVFIYNSTFCPHTAVFMCFVWIWEQTIISLYSVNCLVFYNRDGVCLLRGTDWVFIYNSTFCPHIAVFVCFVWIWEQTTIISLHSINCLVFITEMECVYCAVRGWVFKFVPLDSRKRFSTAFPYCTANRRRNCMLLQVQRDCKHQSCHERLVWTGEEKSLPFRDSIPGPPSPQPVAIPTELNQPTDGPDYAAKTTFPRLSPKIQISEVRFPGRLLYQAALSLPRNQQTFSPMTISLPVLNTKLSVRHSLTFTEAFSVQILI